MGRPIVGETRKDVRLNIFFEPREVEQIDDFRFRHRIVSRAEAIRRLIQLALAAAENSKDGTREDDRTRGHS